MNSFLIRDKQFWLNEQPLLIQAGEFHYFRTPADQWAHRLGLLRSAGFNAVATYIPWLWHQPEPGLSDLDGHSHPLRNLAGFLDLATELGMYIIARPGPYIMAETINEGIPPWVFSRHPQAAFVSQTGQTQNIASYLQPDFLRCVEGWYEAVFKVLAPRQITRGGNILMVQLDNELGMIQWVRNLVDINPDTLSRFGAYLQHTYGEQLNRRYAFANLTDFLFQQIAQPDQAHGARVLEDYRRFYRAYLRDYASLLWERAKAHGLEVPPVINIHGFGNGGKTFPIGLSQLIDVLGIAGVISATDVYPILIGEGNFHQLLLVNEMTKALQNVAQPLFSIEFQAGGNPDFGGAQTSLADLHSRLCISVGMRAINHYLFCDGENDPVLSPVKRHDWGHPVRKDGSLRSHYHRYPKLSRVWTAYGAALTRSQPETVTTIGFQLDDFLTESNNRYTEASTKVITHQRDTILFDFIARGLALTHRPFAALELTRARLDVAQTPSLWVFMDKQCDETTQRKLVAYVRGGGQLILIGRVCEETFDHAPCTVLKDALGIQRSRSDPPFTPATIQAFAYRDVPVSFLESYSGAFDEVFATSADGQPVGFRKQVGQGQALVLGAALPANTLDDLDIVHQMALKLNCQPLFSLSHWADVRLSTGDQGSFLFINNYQDDPVETIIAQAGIPLFNSRPIRLAARCGLCLPIEWQAAPGLTVHYLTAEVTAVNDDGTRLTLTTEPAEFFGEVSLTGYGCDESLIEQSPDGQRLKLHGKDGVITLTKVKA